MFKREFRTVETIIFAKKTRSLVDSQIYMLVAMHVFIYII